MLDENKLYDKQLQLEKAASSANAPIFSREEEDGEAKANTKRKAEEGPEEKQSKQIKSESPDVKVSLKPSGGFGKFEFSKEHGPAVPPPKAAPEVPLELRKNTSQGSSDATATKDPNKLSIKLGASKRLIPSALLRAKAAQATATTSAAEAVAATTATDSEASITVRARTTRSSTLAQRPLPMIGKRPTRRTREQPKEPPAEERIRSSLDDFLLGSGGEALPVISDVKEVTPVKKPEEEEKKAEDFVPKEIDIASAFKSIAEFGNPEEMEFIQIDEASDDELVEMPEIPGGEQEENSSLPAPIPPPPAN